jgi:hypothetical protein
MSLQKKRKSTKKTDQQPASTKKATAKRQKVKVNALAVVDEDSNIITSEHAPVGQRAKSQRCTQHWTRQAVCEARDTGGILLKPGEEYTPNTCAADMKYSELDEIRCSKKYTHGQQEVTQHETLVHYGNMQVLKRLCNKRTVDLKMVCAYLKIIASLNPQHAEIRYKPDRVVIADTINIYMHLSEPEDVRLAQLRQALCVTHGNVQIEIETREGLIAFIRRYTEDDYFKKKDEINK